MSATPDNPYTKQGQPAQHDAWERGFSAGQYEAGGQWSNERRCLTAERDDAWTRFGALAHLIKLWHDEIPVIPADVQRQMRDAVTPLSPPTAEDVARLTGPMREVA